MNRSNACVAAVLGGAAAARAASESSVPGSAANKPMASMSRRLIEFKVVTAFFLYRGGGSCGLPL
jgi:hypothetical protein